MRGMKKKATKLIAYAATCVIFPCAFADDKCSTPQIDSTAMDCLLQDLRETETRLNTGYRTLMSSANENRKAELQAEQLSWIKARNATCQIDDKIDDRFAWLSTLSANHSKALCVTRETNNRILQIENLINQASPQKNIENPKKPHVTALADFLYFFPVSRKTGKWYFELSLDRTGIAKSQEHIKVPWPTIFWVGCVTPDTHYYFSTQIRLPAGKYGPTETIGFAIDLDQGNVYSHQNGHWSNGTPNRENGKKIKQGESYFCVMDSTIAIHPLLTKKILQINLGESPFKYSPPDNFKALHRGFLWIQGGETEDRKLYFDYRQLQEDPVASAAFVKEEFFAPRDSGDGLPSHTSRIAQAEIDCTTEKMTEQALMLLSKDGTVIGKNHKPRDVDHRAGLDTVGGRFVRSVCFLRKHEINLPPPQIQDIWEEMQSPVASVRIMEATGRRQFRNGLLFVKQMNETDTPISLLGKSSRKLVAVSALDCQDIATNQLVGIRYDEAGVAIGIDFFMEKKAIRLEKNKQRFANACISQNPPNTR